MNDFRQRLPAQRLETRLAPLKPPLTNAQAVAEANRCIYCHDAPCIAACPTTIDIPEFIRKIATGNLAGSARTILDSNILGLSCAQVCPVEVLCEGSCVYNLHDSPPIKIGLLQRHATEWAYGKGLRFFHQGTPTGKRVAIVGAGPAGLACAHDLARLGHQAVIFERRQLPGGLNTTGCAPYKITSEQALREVEYVLGIGGIELRTGVEAGADPTWETLLADHHALFLGVGLGDDSRMGIPGEDLEGVVGAVAWVEKIKNDDDVRASLEGIERVVVVGGGNTAIDVVRECCQLGVPEVTMLYRRSAAEMPAYAHEVEYARKEGARFVFLAAPVAYLGEGGRLNAVRCVAMRLAEPDASGRRRPEPVPGSEFDVPADMAALAIGQEKLERMVAPLGVRCESGRVVVDAKTGMTSRPGIFAGGDCANGGKEVVNGAAEGMRAARGIDLYLKG